MYLYFDKTGRLKEIINDEALRQGNHNINKMYVYVAERNVSSIDISYLLPSQLIVGPQNYSTKKTEQIPFDEKRDLKYFKYFTNYQFVEINLEADINGNSPLDEAGLVSASLIMNLVGGGYAYSLGEVNFNVEVNTTLNQKYVASQEYLSLSDYQFLRGLIEDTRIPVVEVNDYSGTLSNSDYALLEKPVAAIVYEGKIYYKAEDNEEEDNMYFDYLGAYINDNHKFVREWFSVSKEDKSYAWITRSDQLYVQPKVELENNSGTMSIDDYLTLLTNDEAIIVYGGKTYYKAEDGDDSGYLVFESIHHWVNADKYYCSSIRIDISTREYELVTNREQLAKILYKHNITFTCDGLDFAITIISARATQYNASAFVSDMENGVAWFTNGDFIDYDVYHIMSFFICGTVADYIECIANKEGYNTQVFIEKELETYPLSNFTDTVAIM